MPRRFGRVVRDYAHLLVALVATLHLVIGLEGRFLDVDLARLLKVALHHLDHLHLQAVVQSGPLPLLDVKVEHLERREIVPPSEAVGIVIVVCAGIVAAVVSCSSASSLLLYLLLLLLASVALLRLLFGLLVFELRALLVDNVCQDWVDIHVRRVVYARRERVVEEHIDDIIPLALLYQITKLLLHLLSRRFGLARCIARSVRQGCQSCFLCGRLRLLCSCLVRLFLRLLLL
mmetsp:Transcript_32498/g.89015  ORF Transcript_32498/g.89015 Transcript_32498/m.89015 type:complete len:232 (-) Transcript_32498:328-1023(-)